MLAGPCRRATGFHLNCDRRAAGAAQAGAALALAALGPRRNGAASGGQAAEASRRPPARSDRVYRCGARGAECWRAHSRIVTRIAAASSTLGLPAIIAGTRIRGAPRAGSDCQTSRPARSGKMAARGGRSPRKEARVPATCVVFQGGAADRPGVRPAERERRATACRERAVSSSPTSTARWQSGQRVGMHAQAKYAAVLKSKNLWQSRAMDLARQLQDMKALQVGTQRRDRAPKRASRACAVLQRSGDVGVG